MALTSSDKAQGQLGVQPARTGRVAQFVGRFWLGRLWLGTAWLRRTVLGTLAFFCALVLFAIFALPPIAIHQAERAAQETLHRRLTIDRIHVNPFSLRVEVHGLRLMEPDGTTVFASFDELDVRISPASLTYLAPVIREVHLIRPFVHLVRTGPNAYNTQDMVATLMAKQPPPTPKAETAPARFAVHNIHIEGGRFDFDDVPESAHHTVTDFALGVPFVSSFVAEEEVFVEPHLRAVINGAPLQIGGKALPFAPAREAFVNLDFDDVDLSRYNEYLPAAVPFRLPGGRLDLHVQVNVKLPHDQGPQLSLAGKATIKGLDLAAADGKPLLKLSELNLAVTHANFPSGPLDVAVTVNGTGRLAVLGETAFTPLHADLAVQIDDLDLLPLQPIIADRVNLRITRAGLTAKGHVRVDENASGAVQGDIRADATLAKLATVDAVNASDFVSWDALELRALHAVLAPLAIHLDEVALKNFYARVIIDPSGRINLQDIVRGQSEAKRSLTEAGSAGQGAGGQSGQPATAAVAGAQPSGASASMATSAPAAQIPISVGKLLFQKGHVRFTDNFIRPKYSADLMNLAGSITGLSSDPQSAADIDLHGKVNDAPLLIGGRINPLARELSLDVKASVHDMELAPLTTYSNKYVGYRIERGKLSFDVAYQLQNRQLHAQNRLVLDQLTFGEKVESASATSLPVLLAVALLKDRNGVIDINLPIEGSLDDPEFSVGGIILKVLINLITKAITAPFALLGQLFGGGEELSWLDFPPGQYAVTPAAEPKLKSLAAALNDRPGLKLDITGWADPVADREALRQVRLNSKLRELKRKDMASRGTLVPGAEVVVTPQEYPSLLRRVYEADLAAKSGAAPAPPSSLASARAAAAAASVRKPQPSQQEMEQSLLAEQQITEDDLRALGNRRALETKEWLTTIGIVPEERVSLLAAKIGAGPQAPPAAEQGQAAQGAAPAGAPSASRVEFALR